MEEKGGEDMRILQSFRYTLGTKPPFDQLPAMIDSFLHTHNLTHRVFHYYFDTYDHTESSRAVVDGSKCLRCFPFSRSCEKCRSDAERYLRNGTGCQRAVKENAFLRPMHIQQTQYDDKHILHNFEAEDNWAKAAIYGILPKIYRRYGFSNTQLIYRDIDFFSRRTYSPAPAMERASDRYSGSAITILRSIFPAGNVVILTIASDDPSDVPDATIYAEALRQHLGCKKYLSFTDLVMDDQETEFYENLNQQAVPLIKAAKEFFKDQMPEEKGNELPAASVSVAAYLKKFGKRYGYTYQGYEYYMYFMEKRLANGHFICLEFVSNPSSPDADPFVNLVGLGFHHQIWFDGFSPQNPQDASEYFTKLFDTLTQAEKSVFPAILDLYPQTPDWFMPTH